MGVLFTENKDNLEMETLQMNVTFDDSQCKNCDVNNCLENSDIKTQKVCKHLNKLPSIAANDNYSFISVKERIKFFSDMENRQQSSKETDGRMKDSSKKIKDFNSTFKNPDPCQSETGMGEILPRKPCSSVFVKEKVNHFNNALQNTGINYKIKVNQNFDPSKMTFFFGKAKTDNVSSSELEKIRCKEVLFEEEVSNLHQKEIEESPLTPKITTANIIKKEPLVPEDTKTIDNKIKTEQDNNKNTISLDLNGYNFKTEKGKESPTFKDILQRLAFNRELREKEKKEFDRNSTKFPNLFMNAFYQKIKPSAPLIRKPIRRPKNEQNKKIVDHGMEEIPNIQKKLKDDFDEDWKTKYYSTSTNLRRFSTRILTDLEENDDGLEPGGSNQKGRREKGEYLYEDEQNLENCENEKELYEDEPGKSSQLYQPKDMHSKGLLQQSSTKFYYNSQRGRFPEKQNSKKVIFDYYGDVFETIQEEEEDIENHNIQEEKQNVEIINKTKQPNSHKNCPPLLELIEETGKMCISLGSKLLKSSQSVRNSNQFFEKDSEHQNLVNRDVHSNYKNNSDITGKNKDDSPTFQKKTSPEIYNDNFNDQNFCPTCNQTMSNVIRDAIKMTIDKRLTVEENLNENLKSWGTQSSRSTIFIRNLVNEFLDPNQQMSTSHEDKRREIYHKILHEISRREKRLRKIGEELSACNEIVKNVINELSFHCPIY